MLSLLVGTIIFLSSAVIAQQTAENDPATKPATLPVTRPRPLPMREELQKDLDASDEEMNAILADVVAVTDEKSFVHTSTYLVSRMGLAQSQPKTPKDRLGMILSQQKLQNQADALDQKSSEIHKTMANLLKTTENPNATPKQLADRLDTARQLDRKCLTDVRQAEDELRKNLTERQQAMCVIWGYLDVLPSDVVPNALPPISKDDADRARAMWQRSSTGEDQAIAQAVADLDVSDSDAEVLRPLIQNCFKIRRLIDAGRRSVQYADPSVISISAIQVPAELALLGLYRLLDNPDTPIEDIESQEQLVQQVRQKADDDYAAACERLRSAVTLRQEAMLYLDAVIN
jgi:hypothetical protein